MADYGRLVFLNVPFDARYRKLLRAIVFAIHECGLFLGARQYDDDAQRGKVCLILDRDQYRYQIFCSDIAGQDIRTHGNDVAKALAAVRGWLQTHLLKRAALPGPAAIATRYLTFQQQLPFLCREVKLTLREMSFLDYRLLVEEWLKTNPRD